MRQILSICAINVFAPLGISQIVARVTANILLIVNV